MLATWKWCYLFKSVAQFAELHEKVQLFDDSALFSLRKKQIMGYKNFKEYISEVF